MTIYQGKCPRTYAYFCLAMNSEIGPRQSEHNNTETSNYF